MIRFTLNGERVDSEVDPATPLLWMLRDHLGMTGTKFGCGVALCGACTVHIDGKAARSCSISFSSVANKAVTTIEGLAEWGGRHPLQVAWIDQQVPQCGYCQPGMIMAAAALLKAKPNPTDADIDAAVTNICRCGTYHRIRKAIHAAAERS